MLSYRFREEAWQQLQATRLGKTILFTDHDDWTDAEMVRGYRSQHHVESAFRDLKNVKHLSLRPQRHWTDQKIRVHVFYCVLALMLCSLLRRELDRRGIRPLAAGVAGGVGPDPRGLRRLPRRRAGEEPTIQITLTELTEEQRRLYQALDLGRYRTA